MALTWKQLQKQIAKMTPEQLKEEVVVYNVDDDFTTTIQGFDTVKNPTRSQKCQPDTEVLDVGSPYIYYGS